MDGGPRPALGRNLLVGFVGGVLSVAVFHQAMVFIIGVVGLGEGVVYSFRPTAPLGVPRLISQMFWGGMWGILFAAIVPRLPRAWPLIAVGFAFGVLGPALFGLMVLTPLRGGSTAAVLTPSRLTASILINGMFGLGLAVLFDRLRRFVYGDVGPPPKP